MSKSSKGKQNNRPTGKRHLPHLACALLCENVLQEGSVATLVRVIDTWHVEGNAPSLPPGVVQAHLYVAFKSGRARGKYALRLVLNDPDGGQKELPLNEEAKRLDFKGGDAGCAVNVISRLGVSRPGVYWIDVMIEGELVTRVPMKIVYRRTDAPE